MVFHQLLGQWWFGLGAEGVPRSAAAISNNPRFHYDPVTVIDGFYEFSLVGALQIVGVIEAHCIEQVVESRQFIRTVECLSKGVHGLVGVERLLAVEFTLRDKSGHVRAPLCKTEDFGERTQT